MPKDLPGFYFDAERNRYYPLSSRPASTPASSSQNSSRQSKRSNYETNTEVNSESTVSPFAAGNPDSLSLKALKQRVLSLPDSLATHRRSIANHTVLCARISSASRFDFSPTATFGEITEFCSATSDDGTTRRYIGDDRGWLYACASYTDPNDCDQLNQLNALPSAQMYMWPPEINLHSSSQISSINISGQKCTATCFGPVTKVAVYDLSVSGRMTLITLGAVHDVRASHLQGNALLLGAKSRAVYIPDIDISGSVQYLGNRQNSDIFTVERDENLVYTGARSGSITRHDLRVPPDKLSGDWLFRSRLTAGKKGSRSGPATSSVLYLKLVKDSQLLVSQMDGNICTYDTRFPVESTPTRVFRGHRNSVTQKLGICVDLTQDFLFAAGEDRRIRGWSLRTGSVLPLNIGTDPAAATPFTNKSITPVASFSDLERSHKPIFTSAVRTMQVTEEVDGSMCLWAGSQQTLYRYFLGQSSFH
ncbi:hypothetical protein BDP27DRAFT_1311187 [Rhodocollybia butyracea]|uniref:Uncharacterized protein n=1 Tax=Rhodocollybia butyracea TaxID=206335 RepID=A0A9P5UEQ7_9AGAR|nr:hypothetical protein BDP27DRAFT_1311187 [Rhodocollybia butyracea]